MASYEIQGRTVTLPVEVRARFLPGDAFEVAESSPGRAQLLLALIDYRDNDLGDYLEVGITLFARPAGGPEGSDGTFIVHLPVDQAFTDEAGRTIWGFPKSVQQISADHGPTSSTWELVMDGQLVLRCTVPRGGADESPDLEIFTYTYLDGVPHRTPFSQGGTGSQLLLGGEGVSLELGDHPIAKELAGLDLAPEAVMSTWTEHLHGTFAAPEPI
jgi:hypothetical protein